MEIQAHEELIGDFAHLADALVEGPSNWMPGMFESPTGQITELQAETPLGPGRRHVRIELGAVKRTDDLVAIPIRWHALDSEALFPVFAGELRLQSMGKGHGRLELVGRYEPPGGGVGRTADLVVMNSVAKTTADDFVHRVAAILARNALARAVADQVRTGTLTLDGDQV